MKRLLAAAVAALMPVFSLAAGLQPAPLVLLPGTITANLCAPGVCAGGGGGGGTIPPSTAAANTFWGGPASGGTSAPSFRLLTEGDIPSIGTAKVYLSTPLLGQSNQDGFNTQVAADIFSLVSTTCQVTVTQGVGTYTFSLPSFVCINANSGAAPTQIGGSVLQLTGADSTNSYEDFMTFGASPSLTFRRADGTNASKSAVQTGEVLGEVAARGYGATNYATASRAYERFLAGNIWTDSNQGTGITFGTTPIGGTATAEAARFAPSGDLLIGTTTDGTGLLQVNGAATLLSARFAGATSGVTTLQPAATASGTITLPAGTTDFSATGGTSQVVKQTSVGGAFTVAQLACADLSNGATGCSTATGTSGATIPLLNGANTWSALQTGTAGMTYTGPIQLNVSNGGSTTLIGTGTTTGTVQLGGSGTQSITIGNGAGAKTVTIGSTTAGSTLSLNAPAAGMSESGMSTGTAADVVCLTSGGVFILQAAGSCTISSARFKEMVRDAFASWWEPIGKVMALRPVSFYMKPMLHANPDHNFDREQIGLIAENVAAVDPRIALYEQDGETPKAYRPEAMISLLTATVQSQQREIYVLMVWCFGLTVAVAFLFFRKRP